MKQNLHRLSELAIFIFDLRAERTCKSVCLQPVAAVYNVSAGVTEHQMNKLRVGVPHHSEGYIL